jgi:chromosomal replication initiator protein
MADYSAVQRVTVAQIQAAVCEEWGCDHLELLSKSRLPRFVQPRHVGMYLTRELTYLSLPRIGKAFGNRDHTTVMYAVERITELMTADPVFLLRVIAVQVRLQPSELVEHF